MHGTAADIQHDVISVILKLMYLTHMSSTIPKEAPKRRGLPFGPVLFSRKWLFLILFLLIVAALISYCAGGLACGLAGGLALTAATLLLCFLVSCCCQSLDPFHSILLS
jgi:4-hydroxybenzoate polyprenyltransferase